MKSVFALAALSLVAAAMPIAASAQDNAAAATIVVTADNQDRWAEGRAGLKRMVCAIWSVPAADLSAPAPVW